MENINFEQFDKAVETIMVDENGDHKLPKIEINAMVDIMKLKVQNYESEVRDPELELTEEQIQTLCAENDKYGEKLDALKECNAEEGCIMITKLLRDAMTFTERVIGVAKFAKMMQGRTVDSIVAQIAPVMTSHVAWNK